MSKGSFFVFLSICMVATFMLVGCSNTLSGAGKDIEKAGQALQKSVND